jgi:hypothetical protein
MAPVLQCPDCGTKHPLSSVPSEGSFPCKGCARVLKVPEAVGQRVAAPGAPTASAVPRPRPVPVASAVSNPGAAPAAAHDPQATRATPGVDEQALGALSSRAGRPPVRLASVPWWMRLLLWIVAVPLSFLVVFGVARAFGAFTTNQLSDVFLANNTGRFWPVARLLPFVALVTATFVQGGVYMLARTRGRRAQARSMGELSASSSRSRARVR